MTANQATGQQFIIEDNIPIVRKARKNKWQEFPFERLAIDQSFHLSNANPKAMSVLAIQAGKRLNAKFAIRTVGETDPRGPGLRIWRVPMKGLDSLFAADPEAVEDDGASEAPGTAPAQTELPTAPSRAKARLRKMAA